MESGIRISWGKMVPGREQRALDLFAEVMTYFGKKVANEELSYFEPFLVRTADLEIETGFIIIKGPAEKVARMVEEDEYRTYLDMGFYLLQHFRVDTLLVGDALLGQIALSSKVRELLKI